jgi:hypothetical protein
MLTIKLDQKKRAVIPTGKPDQVFAYSDNGDGTITLTALKADVKEPFPRGSLKYLCTQARNKELAKIASGTILGVPKDYDQ